MSEAAAVEIALGFLRALGILPVALLVWWLHRYVPMVPELGFGPCLALVVVVHVLRRWV